MGSPEVASSGKRAKVGRPPRISRERIAEAAHELGLERLTLRDVADHLGVSIAALYYHVSSKEDLMRLAAEYTAGRLPLPEDHGQHWAVWLYEWALYNRDAFVAQPGLLAQYVDGAISAEVIAGSVDAILGVLVRQGFGIIEAFEAYELVISCALGTAVSLIREREAAEAGRSMLAVGQVPNDAGGAPLVHLRRLVEEMATAGRDPFHVRIGTVLRGIAARFGLDWAPVQAALDEAVAARRRRPRPGRALGAGP